LNRREVAECIITVAARGGFLTASSLRHPDRRDAMQTFRATLVGWLATICIAAAAEPNPRLLAARDAKAEREFEYLVFDLGDDVELRLVKVPAAGATFMIGSDAAEQERVVARYFAGKRPSALDFEEPASVTLSDDFFIGRAEGGYGFNEATLKGEGRDRKYTWQNTGISSAGERHPVTNVSRGDARAFCTWLRKRCDGAVTVREVRLPGEAEWEYACRAGGGGRFSCGDDDECLANIANIADATWREKLGGANATAIAADDGHVFAAPVGQFAPNAFGIYDMHGNVWEWCADFFGRYAALPKEHNAIQVKNLGEGRPVLRGGSWGTPPVACRSANRWLVGAGPSRYGAAGFRVVVLP